MKINQPDLRASLPILIAILLLGWGVRFHEATRDVRFHSDEALYNTYARNAAVHGHWMLNGPLDKPPLSIYASALGMHFFASEFNELGVIDVPIKQGEFATKIPNIFAGMFSIALIYAISDELFRQKYIALFSAFIVTVSPYAVAYSASAFTDALMLAFMLASWRFALRNRPTWSGVMLALSFAAKPQGILYLPLIVLFLGCDLGQLRQNRFSLQNHALRNMLMFTLACCGGIGVLLLWDSARPETSIFMLGSINISQGRLLTPPEEWLPRLQEWFRIGDNLLGRGWFTAVLIISSTITVIRRRSLLDLILLAMAVGFFLLHWIAAFWTFDRYLLPLVPLFALIIARMFYSIRPSHKYPGLLTVAFVASILVLSIPARHDPRADAFHGETERALIDLTAYLNNKPLGTIIYDRWMGWEMGYYIGAWSDKRRVYYPDPQTQAQDALLNPDTAPRYLIAPENQNYDAWLITFAEVGFEICLDYSSDGFRVYELIPPPGVALMEPLQILDGASVGSSWHDPAWCAGANVSPPDADQ